MLNARGNSCIVWTGDRDLIQLVNYSDTNDAHTVWYYNTKKSLYAYEGFSVDMESSASEELTEDDMLFNMGGQHMMRDAYQRDIMSWVKANKIQTTEVNCDEFIFKKILVGDKSDNIPSVITWQKEMKSGKLRNYSITDKTAESIYKQFVKEYKDFKIDYLFSSEVKDKLSDIIYRVVGHSSLTLIKTNLTKNIGLMLLHNKTIPDPIQKAIYDAIEKDWEGGLENKDVLFEMDKILKDTEWLEVVKKTNFAPDPFAGMDIPEETPMKLVGKKTKGKKQTKTKKDPTKKLF